MVNPRMSRAPTPRRLRPGRSIALVLTGVILSSALSVVVAAVASADPPTVDCSQNPGDGQCRKLVPVLTCVWPNSNGSVTAVFGYANSSSHPISVAVGWQNEFIPNPINQGQPTLFPAGTTVTNAFTVTWSVVPATWELTGHAITAWSTSTKCAKNPVPVVGDWRAMVIALAFCAPIGFIAYRRLRPRWVGFRWAVAATAQPRSK
jgi:hypothetical protein